MEGFALLLGFCFCLILFGGLVGVYFTESRWGAWIDDCFVHGCTFLWGVEFVQTSLSVGEVAVVEGIAVHLHQEGQGVEGEEDLGSPCPFEVEWPFDPDEQPDHLVQTLYPHACVAPLQPSTATPEHLLEGQTCRYAQDHQAVGKGQGVDIPRKQFIDVYSQRVSSVSYVLEGRSYYHNAQAHPEEYEETFEVAIFTSWVEVGGSRLILDCME